MQTKKQNMKRNLLLAGMIGVGLNISAQINHTDISPDASIVATTAGQSYMIDMDGDQTDDLNILALQKDTTLSGFPVTIIGIAVQNTSISHVVGDSRMIGQETVYEATFMNQGDTVQASLNYVNSSSQSLFPGISLGADNTAISQPIGNFIGLTGYFGVRMDNGADANYGWVRVTVNATHDTCIIESYALNATLNEYILAGDTGGGMTSIEETNLSFNVLQQGKDLFVSGIERQGSLTIYNLLGQPVFNSNAANMKIDLSSAPSGAYIVAYESNGKRVTKKILL